MADKYKPDGRKNRTFLIYMLMENPFPDEYLGSKLFQWIKRIEKGEMEELKLLSQYDDGPGDVNIFVEDEYFITMNISENMYAVLFVYIWSQIEKYQSRLIRVCSMKGKGDLGREEHHKIKSVVKYFSQNVGIEIKNLNYADIANAVRICSNSFKHNNGRYKPDNVPIVGPLQQSWGIEEGRPIKYGKLPLEKIINGCQKYCENLAAEVRKAVL